MTDVDSFFLEHFGVKGQKWGVRRAPKRYSVDAKKVRAVSEKHQALGIKSLTNHEIQQYNHRLEMEAKFNQLTPTKSKQIKAGHKFVKELVGVGATLTSAVAFLNTPVGKALSKGLVKKAKPVGNFNDRLRSL